MTQNADLERVISLLNDELARLAKPLAFSASWWEYGQRRWQDGVRAARAVEADHLQAILDEVSLNGSKGTDA